MLYCLQNRRFVGESRERFTSPIAAIFSRYFFFSLGTDT